MFIFDATLIACTSLSLMLHGLVNVTSKINKLKIKTRFNISVSVLLI